MENNSFTTNEILNFEKEIFQIIKTADSLNKYFKENIKKLDTNYLITLKDIKLFQFIFKYFIKSLKYKDIDIFFRLQNKKIICKNEPNILINLII
jgi:fucose 4-O-acetylase-like acetyltransferase